MHVSQRIDAEGSVIDKHSAPEEADDQARPPVYRKAERTKRHCRRDLEAVKPHQFGKLGKIRDPHKVRSLVLAIENPSNMRVEEALVPGRMDVVRRVGMQMMVPML